MTHTALPAPAAPLASGDLLTDVEFLRWRVDELEQSESRLRALIEHSGDVITLVAPIGTILYQSPSIGRILGYGHTELFGSSLFERVHHGDVSTGMQHWSVVSQTPGRAAPVRFRFRHKDGTWRWLDGTATNLTHEPAVRAIVLNLRDVTESRRAEDGATRASRDLQRQAGILRRLPRAVRLVSEAGDLPALLTILAREARAMHGVIGAAVFLCERDSLRLAEIQPPPDGWSGEVPVSGIVSQVAQTALPAEAADPEKLSAAPDPLLLLWGADTRQRALAVPLLCSGRAQGVLAIVSVRGRPFAEHERNALLSIAEIGAAGLERVRLPAAEERVAVLSDSAELLAGAADEETALDSVLGRVARFAAADVALMARLGAGGLEIGHRYPPLEPVPPSSDDARAASSIGAPLRELLAAERELAIADAATCLELGLPSCVEACRSLLWIAIPHDGTPSHWLCLGRSAPGLFEPARVDGLRAVARQIGLALGRTAMLRALRAEAARAQALSHRLVEVQEAERARIAREIHDAAGQSLTSILLGLRRLDADEALPDCLRPALGSVRQEVSTVLDGLHQLATNLRPPALDHAGLAATIQQMANSFQAQSGIAVRFETLGFEGERFAPETETALYRIIQEALTNVVRHARASRADVILERRPDALIVIVEDDGEGFDGDASVEGGRLGLVGMRERASMLGGRLTIESSPGSGTTVQATVPLPASTEAAASPTQLTMPPGGDL